MLSYSDIIKKSYYITISNRILWLFGLFVIGASNLNFLFYQNVPLKTWYDQHNWQGTLDFLADHPAKLALLSLSILVFTLASLVLTNWSRIMLLLVGRSILEDKLPQIEKQFKQSPYFIWPVIKISLWTAALMLFVVAVIFSLPVFLEFSPALQNLLLILGGIIFLPLAFTISCVNIFTTFYLVLFKKPIATALNLGTDFFVSRWAQILGLVVLLVVIYCAVFVVGVGLIFVARVAFDWLLLFLNRLNILSFSAIIPLLKVVSSVLSWFLLAGLSVFFNQALLILFLDLNAPIKAEEISQQAAVVPAPLS